MRGVDPLAVSLEFAKELGTDAAMLNLSLIRMPEGKDELLHHLVATHLKRFDRRH